MRETSAWALGLLVMLAASAVGQVPPGYELVTLAPYPPDHYTARMNNHFQIVFDLWKNGGDTDAIDIMLYDNGQYIRLTDDNVYDRQPDINDDGTIVWSRAVHGPGTHPQIVVYQDGVLTQITDSAFDELDPRINNRGHVVWSRWKNEGCDSADIYFYDGQTIHQITNDAWSNQSAVINDDDWIAWTEYNFCDFPWTSKIMLWVDGVVTQLTAPDTYAPQGPTVNNLGQVAWMISIPGGQVGIQLWQAGSITTLTSCGGGPQLNNRAEIAFYRWYPGTPIGSYEAWLYRNGQFLQITSDPHDQGWNNTWSYPTCMNDRGEMVLYSGKPWNHEGTIEWMKLKPLSKATAHAAPLGGFHDIKP